jgi:choline dehydrogenase
VETSALVHRVVFDGRRAVGVAYSCNGLAREATAAREILVCGGAVNSPQMLMLSGVGPATHLREHGIEPVLDAPGVGQGLQDHLHVACVWETEAAISANREFDGVRLAANVARYYLQRRGALAVSPATVAAFIRVMPGAGGPDIQLNFRPLSSGGRGKAEAGKGPPKITLDAFPGVTGSVCVLRPESRGQITLRSSDPADPVVIEGNYLASERDRRTMVAGFRELRRIFETEPMRGKVVREEAPGADCRTDEDILEFIKANAGSMHHQCCTCRMGQDAGAVVDARLRVRGIEGLRVVDASVMPTLISGNTNAPVIMIAEKAAEFVLADRRP